MNRAQFNRTEMFNTVSATMQTNQSLWGGFPAIVQTMTEFNASIATIGTKMMQQGTPITGAAQDKAQVRLDLEARILLFADQIAALAAVNHDMTLAGQADLTLSALDKQTDDALEETGKRIKALAVANASALEDYGILGDDVTELDGLITQFHNVKTAPRAAIAGRKGQTDTLPDVIGNTTSLLRNRLDKLMTRFKTANPVFYAAYQSARVIVDKGTPAAAKQPAPAKQPQ